MEPPLINAERIALLKPMEEVSVDYAVYAGKNFLVMVDRATSYTFVEETKHQTITETIKVLARWFHDFGFPRILRADDGPSFRNNLNLWLASKNVIRETSAAYNPQSNGLAERAVRRCKEVIKKCLDEGRDWRTGIAEMRTQPSSVLNWAAPAETFHGGRMPRSSVLPALPETKNVNEIMAFRSAWLEKMAANAKSRSSASMQLAEGDKVRIQDHIKPFKWSRVGEVLTKREHGSSYFVETLEDEKTLLRNRRHIKPLEPSDYKLVDILNQGEGGKKVLSGMIKNLSKSLEEMDGGDMFEQSQSEKNDALIQAPYLNTRSRNRSG